MGEPLFKPFRALGYITDPIPFAVRRQGKETYATVSVGKTWQVYNCNKLHLTLVGPQLEGSIRALAAKGDFTYAAVNGDIVECKRVHRSGTYSGGHASPIIQLMLLGEFLLSLDGSGRLCIWDEQSYDAPNKTLELGENGSKATCMVHPETYLNKILIGFEDGSMHLWNFVSGKRLHVFEGWGSPIRCLVSSPALDVVAAGLADGRAVLHNIRLDEQVMSFDNAGGSGLGAAGGKKRAASAGCACTAISFRTGAGAPLMAAGGSAGALTVWNLEGRQLQTVLGDAHDRPVVALHFFAGQPLLMSSGADNAVKHWIFDNADGSGRLVRFRSGHADPPTCLQHYGPGGLRLLSAGCDRTFRVFSTIQDQQSRELSQKNVERRAKKLKVHADEVRLPPVFAVDACDVRERDWCNVLTAHEGETAAYTWRLAHFVIGEKVLETPAEELYGRKAAPVTSVAVSRCGNYGVVGTASGRVDRYNMQSGIHRGAYYRKAAVLAPPPAPGAPVVRGGGGFLAPPVLAHDSAIVGMGVTGCNQRLVTAGFDGALRVWDFKSQRLLSEVRLGGPAVRLALHASSGLAAVALADASLRVYEVDELRLVRRFYGHKDRITALQLSSDARWLLSASMDGTLRVWDVPVAGCLQVLVLGSPVTALSLSPARDLLATCHSNKRGIYLWSNSALFSGAAAVGFGYTAVLSAPSADAQPAADGAAASRVVRLSLPTVSGAGIGVDGQEGRKAAAPVLRGWFDEDSEDEGEVELEDEEESNANALAIAALPDASKDRYRRRDDRTGAPVPLAPMLVTLSMLPRSQWSTLRHLDDIRARNKPLQPPKKPETAPFFLPTLPTLAGNPVFDPNAAAAASEAGQTDRPGLFEELQSGSTASRVLGTTGKRGQDQIPNAQQREVGSPFSVLLRALAAIAAGSGRAEAHDAFVAHLRSLSANALDQELRALDILVGSRTEEDDVSQVGALLDVLTQQLAAGQDFELSSAVLGVLVEKQGEVLVKVEALRPRLVAARKALTGAWARLDDLLQGVRCMAAFFGEAQ